MPAAHPRLRNGPEEIVRHVLFAAPDHLDRDAGELLGDERGLPHVVLRAAPPEAAAQHVLVDLAFFERQTGGLGERRERRFAVLRRHPGLGLVRRVAHRAVHRLHRRVREERRAVDGLDLGRRVRDGLQCIAFVAHRVHVGGREALLQVRGDLRAGLRRVRAFVPHDRQRLERGLRMPPRVGDDGDGRVVHPHGALDARHRGDLGVRRSSRACRRTPGNP